MGHGNGVNDVINFKLVETRLLRDKGPSIKDACTKSRKIDLPLVHKTSALAQFPLTVLKKL